MNQRLERQIGAMVGIAGTSAFWIDLAAIVGNKTISVETGSVGLVGLGLIALCIGMLIHSAPKQKKPTHH